MKDFELDPRLAAEVTRVAREVGTEGVLGGRLPTEQITRPPVLVPRAAPILIVAGSRTDLDTIAAVIGRLEDAEAILLGTAGTLVDPKAKAMQFRA